MCGQRMCVNIRETHQLKKKNRSLRRRLRQHHLSHSISTLHKNSLIFFCQHHVVCAVCSFQSHEIVHLICQAAALCAVLKSAKRRWLNYSLKLWIFKAGELTWKWKVLDESLAEGEHDRWWYFTFLSKYMSQVTTGRKMLTSPASPPPLPMMLMLRI